MLPLASLLAVVLGADIAWSAWLIALGVFLLI
jgi:hypothetical protein